MDSGYLKRNSKRLLVLAVMLSFSLSSFFYLLDNLKPINKLKTYYDFAREIRQHVARNSNVISNKYEEGVYIAFHSRLRFFGVPSPNKSCDYNSKQAKSLKIKYFLYVGEKKEHCYLEGKK